MPLILRSWKFWNIHQAVLQHVLIDFASILQDTYAKMIINAGISEVIYYQHYTIDDVSLALLREAGVVVRPLDENEGADA